METQLKQHQNVMLQYNCFLKQTFYVPDCYLHVWSKSLKEANHFTMPWYQRTHRLTGVPPGVSAAIFAIQSLRYHDIIKELHCQQTIYVPNCYVWSKSLKEANHFTMPWYQRTHRLTGVSPGVSAVIFAIQSLRYQDIIKELHCQQTIYVPNCYVWSKSLKEANHFTMPWYQRTHRLTGMSPGVSAAIFAIQSLRYHDIIKELHCQQTIYVPNCYVWSKSLKEANHFTMPWYQRTHRLTGVSPGVSAAIFAIQSLRYHDNIVMYWVSHWRKQTTSQSQEKIERFQIWKCIGYWLVLYWKNNGKSTKTPTLDKEIHFPTLVSQKLKTQGWKVIFALPSLVIYEKVQHGKHKTPRLEGHILYYQVC